jgi:hypothetical protein
MSEREYHGKEEEKTQEKEQEKGAEKTQGDFGEKYRNDPLGGIVVACCLIWAGIAWILSNFGVFGEGIEPWPLVFTGAGVIVILGVIVRLLVPEYRRPVRGNLILGFILIGIGLGQLFGWSIIGPVVLIAIAISIIIGVVTRKG